MSCGKVLNFGTKITGGGSSGSTWADNCPVDNSVVWPSTGNKNVRIEAVGSFPQTLPVDSSVVLADMPLLQATAGTGTEQQVNYYEFSNDNPTATPDDPPQGEREYFNTCAECGLYNRATLRQKTVKTGQHGTIYTPQAYLDNFFSARFNIERAAEILLTDESGKRGLRCGYAVRIKSSPVELQVNSSPTALITDSNGAALTGGVKVPSTLDFVVEIAYYIKQACDVADPFGEYDESITSHAPIELTTQITPAIVPLTEVPLGVNGQWKTFAESVSTSRSTSNDCTWGYREYFLVNMGAGAIRTLQRTDINSCWYPSIQNFTWQEPERSADSYMQIDESALQTELAKHGTAFWADIANRYQKESAWQKYPLYGPIPMRLTKRESTLEFRLTGNPAFKPLTWTNPFVNRILRVSVNDGTTLVSTTVL